MQKRYELYHQRQQEFTTLAQAHRKRYDRSAVLRLGGFLGGVALGVLVWSLHWAALVIYVPLFIAGFYKLVQWHSAMLAAATYAEQLAAVNLEEKEALEGRYTNFPSGIEYMKAEHPNAYDLDLFGEYSFFQYACRATTVIGRERLADFLSQPADAEEIASRHEAITELRPLLEWRQGFRASGTEVKDDPAHLRLLEAWLKDENLVLGNGRLRLALWLAPVWSLVCLVLWIGWLPWQVVLLLFIPTGWLLKKTKERVDAIHRRTTYAGEMLELYAGLLQHIESQQFTSKRLASLREPLLAAGHPSSTHIRRLSYLISQLNVRFNIFAIFLNLLGVWDLQWVYRLEKWKASLHDRLPAWFEALREFEALSSFANVWYNNPEWTLPDIGTAKKIKAVQLGHPLISSKKRISNDLAMPSRGHIKLITGSNMAGKSTFLRTVGLNLVLAQSGSPVCAQRLAMPRLQVFTSMRTQDTLHDSTSSFYAELKRLKVIIEAVKNAQSTDSQQLPVFFLLDEILKGTNSVDRHTGGEALIRQLIRQRGSGLIATHDLELGKLEAEADGAIENLCMEVEVENGVLNFDYKLKKGVSQSFNATLLMRQMGIEV